MSSLHSSQLSTAKPRQVILITDIGSVDLDDTFALLLLASLEKEANLSLSVITTQHYSKHRATMAKLILTEIGYGHVPVYYHRDLEYNPEAPFDQKLRDGFDERHKLWPGDKFGYPHGCRKDGEKDWFPGFMQSFRKHYSQEHLDQITDKLEAMSGLDYLKSILNQPKLPLISQSHLKLPPMEPLKPIIINIGPNDIFQGFTGYDFLNFPNFHMWSMGGGYIKDYDQQDCHKEGYGDLPLVVSQCNYNWGVSTEGTRQLLDGHTFSETQLRVVSSHIVKAFNSHIPNEIYEKWAQISSQSNHPLLKSIMDDWQISIQSHYDSKKTEKTMSDPLTVMLAIFYDNKYDKYHTSRTAFQMAINDSKLSHYQESVTDNEIVTLSTDWGYAPNVYLIDEFDPVIVTDMIAMIDQTLTNLVN